MYFYLKNEGYEVADTVIYLFICNILLWIWKFLISSNFFLLSLTYLPWILYEQVYKICYIPKDIVYGDGNKDMSLGDAVGSILKYLHIEDCYWYTCPMMA